MEKGIPLFISLWLSISPVTLEINVEVSQKTKDSTVIWLTLMSVNVPQRYLHIYIYWSVIYNIQDQDIMTHIHIGV